MAEFRMPSLGADMEAGTLVEWKVQPGDRVERGQVIASVETDKGLIEVEIWESGTVEAIEVQPGTKVPVGTTLARIRGEGKAPAPAPAPAPLAAPAPASAPPRPAHRKRISPAARKHAAARGIDPETLEGTGPGGAVTIEDVERAAAAAPPPAPAAPDKTAAMRRAIAASMARSKREIPHYYLATEIELTAALAWLEEQNRGRPIRDRLLPVALLLKAVALAARDMKAMNGFYVDDAFRPGEGVHLGAAIALRGGGLVAPAIHDADRKTPAELMAALGDLIARVRAGTIRASELADPTLTVTSLGDLGVPTVYGVIHPPQVALVGFGRIGPRPFCVEGGVVARQAVVATLAADHRVSDGVQGARFLAAIDRLLQRPEAL